MKRIPLTYGRGYYERTASPENCMTPDFLKEFIEMYRSLPCLWKMKSADYLNKQMKQNAYESLVNLCKKVCPTANTEYVKNKIANLRTVFKKELKKVELSRKSGASASEIYVPRLWYFELLKFTVEHDVPKQPEPFLLESQLSPNCSIEEEKSTGNESFEAEISNFSQVSTPMQSDVVENEPEELIPPRRRMKRKACNDDIIEKQLLLQAAAGMAKTEDECDHFGLIVASKLRKMDENQRLAAEMIITDVLFKGMVEKLNVNNPIGCYTGQVHNFKK
ncbi:hypothetical protein GDO86_011969 [Hymenochirus boettgeri]|uniref:MADF domain-containing protein n=1 Tax=Hymenochirus boettgeri TaxID=247094 RepID=A0A8T2JII4_9PIPI|nr:hypothetical protein GDO86_011969 [Hymenochirus boettgeri]